MLFSGSWVVNPDTVDIGGFDDGTRRLLRAIIEWFDARHPVEQFPRFTREVGLFSTCLIPAMDGGHRWDTARNEAVSEILGFYRAECWLAWHEAVSGVVPSWLHGDREERTRLADFLLAGGVPTVARRLRPGTADAAFAEESISGFTFVGGAIGFGGRMLHQAVNEAYSHGTGSGRQTDSPAVRKAFGEAYLRLVAGKLFAVRATDYARSADRRYLLFAAVGKGMAITEARRVSLLLREFSDDITMFPGHYDVTAILRFAEGYLLHPAPFDPVPPGRGPSDDGHLFQQRATAPMRFHNWRPSFDSFEDLRNVRLFRDQVEQLCSWISRGVTGEAAALGHLFQLVVYGHLVLEQADLDGVSRDVVDGIAGLLAGDCSARLQARDNARMWPHIEALVGEYSPRR